MARVNLKAIAHAAGVSISTASRVLSQSNYPVTAELRDRVLAAARRLDYVPNAQAQGLLRGNPRSVGVLTTDLADPAIGPIMAGLHREARAQGCVVTTFTTGGELEEELAALTTLQALDVGIVIILLPGHPEAELTQRLDNKLTSLLASDQQIVLIGRTGLMIDAPTVQVNDVLAGRLLGDHLWSLGHRDVAVLVDRRRRIEGTERLRVLRQPFREGLRVFDTDGTRAGADRAVAELLGSHAGGTAVVALTTMLALGALSALRDRGIAVPADRTLVAGEDLGFAADVSPPLTAVDLPIEDLGSTALRLGLAARDGVVERVVLPARLVVRGSSSEARGRARSLGTEIKA